MPVFCTKTARKIFYTGIRVSLLTIGLTYCIL
nr:MAG TPA: hypothetical protein [Caudoviricetes sp.]